MPLDDKPTDQIPGFNSDKEDFPEQFAAVIRLGKAHLAEDLLVRLAHKHGDEALVLATGRMSSVQIAEVTKQGDIVKPSLLHELVSPNVVPAIFRRIGVGWSAAQTPDCDPDILAGFQQEMQEFFCVFILISNEEKRRKEILAALLAEPEMIDALIFAVIGEKDFPEFFARDGRTTETGDWREVLSLVQKHFPEDWNRLKDQLPGDFDPDSNECIAFVNEVAATIYGLAVAEGAVKPETVAPAKEMFRPL